MQQQADSQGRMCCKAEHIKHFVAVCMPLALSGCTNRHNNVAVDIYWTIFKPVRLQGTENFYEHVTETIINVKSTTIMWDIQVIKDGILLTKLPDVIIHDDKEETCLPIYITLPVD
jgi:hypothetical protein